MGGILPSAETLAQRIYDRWCENLPGLSAVQVSDTPVSETPKTVQDDACAVAGVHNLLIVGAR